jgi:hypothetical protein
MSKILYLDYDGVLHHEQVFFSQEEGIHMKMPRRSLFEWMSILDDLLAPHPDIKIVLSTSWVLARNFEFAKSQLSPTLQSRVIGDTFSHDMHRNEFARMPRWMQIQEDVARRAPDAWLALDDDPVEWPEGNPANWIRTESATGISEPTIQNSIKNALNRLYVL